MSGTSALWEHKYPERVERFKELYLSGMGSDSMSMELTGVRTNGATLLKVASRLGLPKRGRKKSDHIQELDAEITSLKARLAEAEARKEATLKPFVRIDDGPNGLETVSIGGLEPDGRVTTTTYAQAREWLTRNGAAALRSELDRYAKIGQLTVADGMRKFHSVASAIAPAR